MRRIALLVTLFVVGVGCTAQPPSLVLVGLCGDDVDAMSVAIDAAPDVAIDAAPDAAVDAAPIDIFPPKLGVDDQGQSNDQGRKSCTNVTVVSTAIACGTYTDGKIWDHENDTPQTAANIASRCASGCLAGSDGGFWSVSNRQGVALSPRAGNNFGPEMSFAYTLWANGAHQIGIGKSASGSHSIAAHFQNHVQASPLKYCTGSNPPCTITPYPVLADGSPDPVNLTQKGINQSLLVEADGYDMRLGIWIQGEHDAAYSTFATPYAANLTARFAATHAQWPNMLIIYTSLNSEFVLNANATVRAAQKTVRDTYPTNPDGSPRVLLVSSEGLAHDSAHFEADGLWLLGVRIADVYLWYLNGRVGAQPWAVP